MSNLTKPKQLDFSCPSCGAEPGTLCKSSGAMGTLTRPHKARRDLWTAARSEALTSFDIDRAMNDDRWLGHGYLGIRQHGSELVAIDDADAVVLAIANEAGLDYEGLFLWLNSRDGRHTADALFSGSGRDDLDRWSMGPRPSMIARLKAEVAR